MIYDFKEKEKAARMSCAAAEFDSTITIKIRAAEK